MSQFIECLLFFELKEEIQAQVPNTDGITQASVKFGGQVLDPLPVQEVGTTDGTIIVIVLKLVNSRFRVHPQAMVQFHYGHGLVDDIAFGKGAGVQSVEFDESVYGNG